MDYVPSSRIREMLLAARERFAAAPESRKCERLAEAFFEIHRDLPWRERQARAYAHALVNEPVLITPGELIQGMIHRKGGEAGDPFCGYHQHPDFAECNAQEDNNEP